MKNLSHKTDEELSFMINNGSKNLAFTELYRRYKTYLIKVSYSITNNMEDAKDVTQNSFIKAYEVPERYSAKCSLKTWLTTIVKNKSIDVYRKKKRNIFEENVELNNLNFFDEEKILDRDKIKKTILYELERIKMKNKEAYVLTQFRGLEYKEAADALGLKMNNLKMSVLGVRRKLKNNIPKKYGKEFFYQ